LPGTILTPTYVGHLDEVAGLLKSLRVSGQSTGIRHVLVISKPESDVFKPLADEYGCKLLYLEDLVQEYTGVEIEADVLLKQIDRYRYQTLKKLLATASLEGPVLFLDSESRVTRDLAPIFDGGLEETTVLFSDRPWTDWPRGLAKDVYLEVSFLLGSDADPFWYFESLNWVFSPDITRQLLSELKRLHGTSWVFKREQLFESQLYFRFARSINAPYRFLPAEELLAQHFGGERASQILQMLYHSPWHAAGIFEFLARFVTRSEYADFIADPVVLKHLRLVRYEPFDFYDVISNLREPIKDEANFFGEAAMHRGELVRGRTAVLVNGDFRSEDDIYNVKRFLAGVDCDIFIAVNRYNWLLALAKDVLCPVALLEIEQKPKPILDRAPADDLEDLERIQAAYSAFIHHEAASGNDYAMLVQMRPNMNSVKTLRKLFWDISENTSNLRSKLFIPERYWGKGLNTDFTAGLRTVMGDFLEKIVPEKLACNVDLNMVFGKAMVDLGIAPNPIYFEYLLCFGDYPDIGSLSGYFAMQEASPGKGWVLAPPFRDATSYLKKNLSGQAPAKNDKTYSLRLDQKAARFVRHHKMNTFTALFRKVSRL
jgi:hypothetical protein